MYPFERMGLTGPISRSVVMIAACGGRRNGDGPAALRYSLPVVGTPIANILVGLLGMSDTCNTGNILSPRITARELGARLPHVEFRMLAPFGWENTAAVNGGDVVEPLGEPTTQRRAELADQLDALIIGGGEIIHDRDHLFAESYALLANGTSSPADVVGNRALARWFVEGVGRDNEPRCPTMWNGVGVPFALTGATELAVRQSLSARPYVSVRDERSLARLRAAGADADIAVIPDPGFLVPRLISSRTLQRRRALHHLLSWLPPSKYVVVQGNASMLSLVGQISAALDGALGQTALTIVALDTAPSIGDSAFGDALRRRCPVPVRVMPSSLGVEDIVAVLEGATAVIGASVHAGVTAMAFNVPTVIMNLDDQSKLAALAELTGPTCAHVTDVSELPAALRKTLVATGDDRLVRSLQAELDAHFDTMAAVIEVTGRSDAIGAGRAHPRATLVAQELRALRKAHDVRGRQLVAERSAFAEAFEQQLVTISDLEARVDALQVDLQAAASLSDALAETRHQHWLAAERVAELDAMVQAAWAERDVLGARAAEQNRRLETELLLANRHVEVLHTQVGITEAALAALYRTKTFRLARIPRRIFGRLKR